jgi:predicted nucleic acid-binding protein
MRQLAASAARLAADLDHPAHDCFYLALAVQEQHPVVTADRRFHDIVRKHPYLSDHIVHVENV